MDLTTNSENDYYEIEPFDQYKQKEAKFRASLKWLFAKAFCNNIPKKFQEPYFEETELGKSLRNDILTSLTSGYIYCKTCENIYCENDVTLENIESVLHMLSRNGIVVTYDNDEPVTPNLIMKDSPFYVSAHLALIDSLMIAFSKRAMKLEQVVNSIRKYTRFNASSELPIDLETTCLFWLNKITQVFLYTIDSECDSYSKQINFKCQPHIHIPRIDNLDKDLSYGSILASLILFYTCDNEIDISSKSLTLYTWREEKRRKYSYFSLKDVSLQEIVSFEESVENLNLVKEFCDKYIASQPFVFNYEDFLYSPICMKINKIAFVAELFYWFEIKPLVCVRDFSAFKDYIKQYTKINYHTATPFSKGQKLGDSFIRKNPQHHHLPKPSLETPFIVNSSLDNHKQIITSTTNNSLLDQVILENSQNFQSDNKIDTINTTTNLLSNDDIEQFSSRTYIKSTKKPTNEMLKTLSTQEAANSLRPQTITAPPTLAISALPGDIFYKVKDTNSESISTSCSTTTQSIESNPTINNNNNNADNSLLLNTTNTSSLNKTTWKRQATSNVNNNSNTNVPSLNLNNHQNDDSKDETKALTKELLSIRKALEARRASMLLDNRIRMQLEEKKRALRRDESKKESEIEKNRLSIGKQAFLQIVSKKFDSSQQQLNNTTLNNSTTKSTQEMKVVEEISINSTHQLNETSALLLSPNNSKSTEIIFRDHSPRKQWDKNPSTITETLIPMASLELNKSIKSDHSSNSASQSLLDLTKPYYSREEMLKALESKANESPIKKLDTPSLNSDIDGLNSRINEIQKEISRLSFVQTDVKKSTSNQIKVTSIPPMSTATVSQENSLNTPKQRTSLSFNTEFNHFDSMPTNTHDNNSLDDNEAFFISFGTGAAKRQKPVLSDKKSIVNVKSIEPTQYHHNGKLNRTQNQSDESLLAAINETNSPSIKSSGNLNKKLIEKMDNHDDELQRKKEEFIRKQMERRQQAEEIRLRREEERMRLAEEQRKREEEVSFKKQVEKKRKEAIFQAYQEKKKQLQEESGGILGKPRSTTTTTQATMRTIKSSPSTQRLQNNELNFDLNTERSNLSKTHSSTTNLCVTKKPTTPCRPPTCARPTISSLCKMNRTFSLHNLLNVDDTNQIQQQQQQQQLQAKQQKIQQDLSYSSFTLNKSNPVKIKHVKGRRRTPRNAEEFLEAAGLDSEKFVKKEYYVGSMYNLNEILIKESQQQQQESNDENDPFDEDGVDYDGLKQKQNNLNRSLENLLSSQQKKLNKSLNIQLINNNSSPNQQQHQPQQQQVPSQQKILNLNISDTKPQSSRYNQQIITRLSPSTWDHSSSLATSSNSLFSVDMNTALPHSEIINNNSKKISLKDSNQNTIRLNVDRKQQQQQQQEEFTTIRQQAATSTISNFNINNNLNHSSMALNNNNTQNISSNNNADYSGPKLYKRLTVKSNKQTVINSLNQLVLAGTVNTPLRKQVLDEIEASDARHFIILFRDYHLQYRGVYSYLAETDYIEKIFGQGPSKITEDMIEKYYKYNSGGKQFSPVTTKHLSIQCDAITIHSQYWQTRKTSAANPHLLTSPISSSTLSRR